MAEPYSPVADAEPREHRRRPYEPPGVVWEEPFEMKANLVSACDKVGGGGFECDSAPAS